MSSQLIDFLHDLPPGSTFKMRINSESMLPFLKVGDRIVVEKSPLDEVQVGDIVVFSNPHVNLDLPVAHRVIEKSVGEKISLKTKGDNSPLPDKKMVAPAAYIGKMIRKESFLKTKLLSLLQKFSF